jgi:L-ascorbate metabolism protein UlaG (beta-lactamase superfamily)
MSLRHERVRSSPRFKDGTFHNTAAVGPGLKKGTAFGVLGEYFHGGVQRNPPAPLPSVDPLPAWARAPETGLRVTWLGHSTVMVELGGKRIITDPVWGDRASPLTFAGPKRFQPVPVPLSKLPTPDAVIVSHDHYDHLDKSTIMQLAKIDVPFFTSLGVGDHLEAYGVRGDRITELDWWESARVPNSEIVLTAAPSQHFSGRGVSDRNHTLWSSFSIRSEKHHVFFSGDTGLTPEYQQIRERLGPFDVVMLEVGAFHEAWGDIHLGPKNALEAHALLGSGLLLPVHWGTFNLAIHAWDEPAETLMALAAKQGTPLLMPRLGVATEPARHEVLDPWWRQVKVPAHSGGVLRAGAP